MNRLKLATVWLDGCSGCHMSLLDMDAAILEVAPRVDLVYGPLVDAQEFPEGVDVTLVEGAVSSQDDLKQLHSLIVRHQQYTESTVARKILDKWDDYAKKFVKVLPTEYRMVLERQHLNMDSDLARLAAV